MPVKPSTSLWDFAMAARANQRAASGRCVLDDTVQNGRRLPCSCGVLKPLRPSGLFVVDLCIYPRLVYKTESIMSGCRVAARPESGSNC